MKTNPANFLPLLLVQTVFFFCLSFPGHAAQTLPPSVQSAASGKNILFVVYDQKNGGITKTFRGFMEAAALLNWHVRVENGNGDPNRVASILEKSAKSHLDGLVIGGFDASNFVPQLSTLRERGVILLGWHAAERPGPGSLLFTNITTESANVAKMAVDVALAHRSGKIGIVLFTDTHFALARKKTDDIIKSLHSCGRCTLLSVQNIDIGRAADIIPPLASNLQRKYGHSWNISLAINDVYFDHINHAIENSNILNIAAGDGSYTAISRIRSGRSHQIATIAEPTSQQAWQMVDEFRRAFSGHPPSGRVCQPLLISQATLLRYGSIENMENARQYKAFYRHSWGVEK
jgi:ribose transport system substrate-binding protein